METMKAAMEALKADMKVMKADMKAMKKATKAMKADEGNVATKAMVAKAAKAGRPRRRGARLLRHL